MNKVIKFLLEYEMWISLGVLLIAINYFGSYGIWAIVVIYVILGLWRMFGTPEARERYKLLVQQVQMQIWGKPLEKEYWKKNEFKNIKYKFVLWSKKNGEDKKNK